MQGKQLVSSGIETFEKIGKKTASVITEQEAGNTHRRSQTTKTISEYLSHEIKCAGHFDLYITSYFMNKRHILIRNKSM